MTRQPIHHLSQLIILILQAINIVCMLHILHNIYITSRIMKDQIGDQRGGSEWELIKILLQRTRPMSQWQLQRSHTNTNRQDNVVMDQLQNQGMIPRSTHGSNRREAKERTKLGKFLCTDQTACLDVADCTLGRGRTVRKTGANCPQYKKCLKPKNTASI
jgi:hypothetical protein